MYECANMMMLASAILAKSSDVFVVKMSLPDHRSVCVSVIVPIYGVERYLRQCIDSILNQTLREIEVILVDDGSPDGCPAIVDEYAAVDTRVRALHLQNGGCGRAVNQGLERAVGEYVSIVEPDDYIEPAMLAELYERAVSSGADVVKGWFYDFLDLLGGQTIRPYAFPRANEVPKGTFRIGQCPVLLYMHPSVWSCLYRRSFLEQHAIRMTEAPGAGWVDNLFQVQTLCLAERIAFVNKPYYYWRRTREEEADDLRDYTIPFKRTEEIHKWLEESGQATPQVLANLYARELNYVLLVSRCMNISDMSDCCARIRRLCRGMDPAILAQAPLTRKARKAYRLCMISPALFIFTRRLRRKLCGKAQTS